jgi:hypothetical protein
VCIWHIIFIFLLGFDFVPVPHCLVNAAQELYSPLLECREGDYALAICASMPALFQPRNAVPAAVAAAAVPFMAAIAAAAAAATVTAAIVPGGETVGCKLDVWKGRAVRTKGGLMRQHLKLNRIGTVVSIKASNAAKLNGNLGNYQFPVKA